MKNNKFSALILSSIISITSMVFFAFNETYAITYDNLQKTELKNLHGWTKINGKWYFTNNSGKKVKSSWLYNHDKWYYMTHDGSMKIGWLKYNNKWYYFDENGANVNLAWRKISGDWYRFKPDGSMVTGWISVSKSIYYADISGKLVTNKTMNIDGFDYTFDKDGRAYGTNSNKIESILSNIMYDDVDNIYVSLNPPVKTYKVKKDDINSVISLVNLIKLNSITQNNKSEIKDFTGGGASVNIVLKDSNIIRFSLNGNKFRISYAEYINQDNSCKNLEELLYALCESN